MTTLAHELGHAYHSWVMRDMSEYECHYTMSLAETASIFAETTLADYLTKKARTPEEKMEVAWEKANNAISLLLNIPARYEFETALYQQRPHGTLSPADLCALTDQAWKKWYGDTLTETDQMFWPTNSIFRWPSSASIIFRIRLDISSA